MRLMASARLAFGAATALLFLACSGPACAADAPAGRWIVVTPPAFRPGLAPLIRHRQAEGFNVVVLETTEVLSRQAIPQPDGTNLQNRLKELFQEYKGRSYVLLVGVFGNNQVTDRVPGLRGAVGRMKDEPSDTGYGMPGLDGAPTLAVGRFPARSAEELRSMVQKTLDFEAALQPASWRNHLFLMLGNPGGGPMAEFFVGQTLAKDLARLHPSWEIRTLFNASSSYYYLPRPRDHETALRWLEEGQLFSVYLGHSAAAGMGLDARFLTREDWAKLNIPHGRGPFFTCGCFACQSNPNGDGYGLVAMRNPTGPVAVIGATGESYSAPGQLAVEGLLTCLAQPPFPSRLADYWLAVQAGLARGKIDPATFALLDMADGTGGKVPLATQRLEHLEMWMLLGDPALRLPIVPVDISLKAGPPVCAGKTLRVEGSLPSSLNGAAVRLTLARPAGSNPPDLAKVPPNRAENRQAREHVFAANHQRPNSFVLAAAEARTSSGSFAATLQAPAILPWSKVIVRASATVSNQSSMGIMVVPVKDVTE